MFSKQCHKGIIFLIFLASYCLDAPLGLAAEPPHSVVIDHDRDTIYLADDAYVLKDTTGELTFEQIQSGDFEQTFEKYDKEVANFGMTGHAYWFKLQLQNERAEIPLWYLGLEYSLLDHIDVFYQSANGEWEHKISGDRRDFDQREIKHRYFYFKLPLPQSQLVPVYIRVQTEGSAEIPLVLKTPEAFAANDHERQLIQGVFIGLMLIMIIYNAMIFIGSRQIEYLLYALFVGSLLIFKGTMNGTTHEYLWPDSIWWANAASAFTTPFVYFMASLYGYKFLVIHEYPKFKKVYWATIITLGSFSLLSFVLPYRFIKFTTIIGMLSAILLLVSSTYCYFKGFKPARFFIFSWSALILGALVFGLQKLGAIPVTFLSEYCIEIASALQAVLLSVGQTDKINEINKKIRRAQKEALEAQIETNRVTEMMKEKLEVLVEERTRDLWHKTKDIQVMMDNLKQGLCTLDQDMKICGEYSGYMNNIFHQNNLDGKSLNQLLFKPSSLNPDQKSQIEATVHSTVGDDTMNFYANEHTLPRQIEVNVDKEDRHFELDWAPIEDQDMTVSKMMVSIRDVTELHAAQSEAKEREHELEIIGQILKLSAAKFQNFMESAFHSIDCCRMIINESNPKEEWHVILRYIHTIKGNSRTYGFEEITQTVHVAEDFLFSCDRENLSDEDLKETCRQLDNIEKILEHYKYINDTKLERSEVGETENTIIEMAKMFKRLAKDGTLANIPFQSSDAKLIKKVESLSQGSFRAAIGPIVESLPSLANQLNKKTPSIIFQGDDFEIEKQFASKYENIFVHLIRNSMDHAFLPHQDGEIVIDIQNHGGNRRIVYHDNGRGLNLKKLKAKGLEHGLIDEQASDDEIANLIFHSGISSADKVTDISGRGVGMDAVKAFLANLGGNISIELLGLSPDSGYRCFRLNLDIPAPETVALDMAS